MKKKLKDFTEEEILRICDSKCWCDDCPFNNIRQGCGSPIDYPEKEIEVPEVGEVS